MLKLFKICKLITLLLAVSLSSLVFAAEPNFSRIVFFGDSLTDNGNFYKQKSFGFIPDSPPYYKGRFSNGKTWAEGVEDYYHQFHINSINNAYGNQTVRPIKPFDNIKPNTLTDTIGNFLQPLPTPDISNTLYILWIGGNDYMDGASHPVDQYTTYVINEIKLNLEKIMTHGGKNLIVLNLPDLSKVPKGANSALAGNLSELTLMHNLKLQALVSALKITHPTVNLHLFDMQHEFAELETNPDKYNQKYHTRLSNVSESCFKGNYFLNRSIEDEQDMLTREITKHIQSQNITRNITSDPFEAEQLAKDIQNSPTLSATYSVGKASARGVKPCNDPDTYLFWDEVHPTAAVHTIFALMMIDYINSNFTH